MSERVALNYYVIDLQLSLAEFNKVQTLTTKPPLLDGTNYAYWKVIMIAFLRAIDDEVWDVVEGYTKPIVVADG